MQWRKEFQQEQVIFFWIKEVIFDPSLSRKDVYTPGKVSAE